MPGPRPTPNLPLSTQYMSFWSPLLGKAEGSKATLAGTPTALQLSLQLPGCRAAPPTVDSQLSNPQVMPVGQSTKSQGLCQPTTTHQGDQQESPGNTLAG